MKKLYIESQVRQKQCSRERASLIPVMAGDDKNLEIPIQHSNKLCMNAAVMLYMVSGCVGGWCSVYTAVRDECS